MYYAWYLVHTANINQLCACDCMDVQGILCNAILCSYMHFAIGDNGHAGGRYLYLVYILSQHALKITAVCIRYYISEQGQPEPARLVKATGTATETPTSMTRRLQRPSEESQYKPVQIPTQETCHPVQDAPLDDQRIVYPKTRRWTKMDSGSKSSPLQPRHSLHVPKQRLKPG